MADKDELVHLIKEWIQLDNGLREIAEKARTLRGEKKRVTDSLLSVMKDHDIDCFNVKQGKLVYTKNKIKAPLSKKNLNTLLMKYFDNNTGKTDELLDFILTNREENIKETIRRK